MTKQGSDKLKERLAAAGKSPRLAPADSAPLSESSLVESATTPAPTPVARRKGQWDKKMQRWTCYIDRDVLRRLHEYAELTGVPRAQIATEGIALWLDQHGAE
jgi:hypothetical protein